MVRVIKSLYHLLVAIIANIWFGWPSKKIVVLGVTGTDGKTTTTSLIYDILKFAHLKASKITSVNAIIAGKSYDTGFHVTTPNAWWVQKYLREAVDHKDTHFVLEVTSHGIDQNRIWGIGFDVGVITNVTHEHLDWHKTFAHYLQTKIKLLRRASVAVINRDEADLYNAALPYLLKKKYYTYGIRRDAQVNPQTFPFKTKLQGEFNRYNCLAALAVAEALGIKKSIAAKAMLQFPGVIGRMEMVAKRPFRVIVDFAHTPNAIEKALAAVRKKTKKNIIHVFGSAGLRDKSKRPRMGEASAKYADVIILTEEDYRTEDVNKIIEEVASGMPGDKIVHKIPSRAEAVKYALSLAKKGDIVIFTGKGHEKSLCRGKVEYPWSDQKEVKKQLRRILNAQKK